MILSDAYEILSGEPRIKLLMMILFSLTFRAIRTLFCYDGKHYFKGHTYANGRRPQHTQYYYWRGQFVIDDYFRYSKLFIRYIHWFLASLPAMGLDAHHEPHDSQRAAAVTPPARPLAAVIAWYFIDEPLPYPYASRIYADMLIRLYHWCHFDVTPTLLLLFALDYFHIWYLVTYIFFDIIFQVPLITSCSDSLHTAQPRDEYVLVLCIAFLTSYCRHLSLPMGIPLSMPHSQVSYLYGVIF